MQPFHRNEILQIRHPHIYAKTVHRYVQRPFSAGKTVIESSIRRAFRAGVCNRRPAGNTHYTTKHSSQLVVFLQARADKIELLTKSIKISKVFLPATKKDSEQVKKLNSKLSEPMAEKGRPFRDGEFFRNCLTIFTEYVCPVKKHMVEQSSLICNLISVLYYKTYI